MFGTRKLGRTSDQRKAMLRAMTTYLFENGKIETTFYRAKEVQPVAEKMVTLAKKNTLASYRKALSYITKEDVANKLFKDRSEVCRPQRRLHPCDPSWTAPRRRSRNGCHRIGVIPVIS